MMLRKNNNNHNHLSSLILFTTCVKSKDCTIYYSRIACTLHCFDHIYFYYTQTLRYPYHLNVFSDTEQERITIERRDF